MTPKTRPRTTPTSGPAWATCRAPAPRPADSAPGVWPYFHLLAAVWVVAMLAFAYAAPPAYEAAMQEDRLVEWTTATVFLAAAAVRLRDAVRHRRVFDLLVGLFCFFVFGEEISWGQRLLGFTPPDAFLANNTQQELNVHNFASVFGQPKIMLMLTLAGYGLLLPAVARTAAGKRLLARIGATAPPEGLVPWFAAAIVLLYWYPVTFTGEWVELLAGTLFLAATTLRPKGFLAWLGAATAAGAVMTEVSATQSADDPGRVACARAEVDALVAGIAAHPVDAPGSFHKRIWSVLKDGYLDPAALRAFEAIHCATDSREGHAHRRRYAVDPWGTAYWVAARPQEGGGWDLVVYSFGPNRRRDGGRTGGPGDDVRAVAAVEP
jgi:hypothetical protein